MPAVAEEQRTRLREFLEWRKIPTWIILLAFTVFYFTDVCLRASSKYLWYDEILTLYFSRLSDLQSLWSALKTGVDSNPPPFDLLTRGTEAIFGQGLIALRLPEIVSFWVLCLCLFKFVKRRAGTSAGIIAMALPMLTGAYYYAYEARPLIIVAALCSVALLCWENALEQGRGNSWLIGFSLALFAALMLHCYAVLLMVPFGFTELVRDLRRRRLNWPFWTALILPLLPAALLYVPLLRAFKTFTNGTDFAAVFPAIWPQVLKFYSFLLLPCTVILLLAFSLFALGSTKTKASGKFGHFSQYDALLTLTLMALPALGVVLAQVVHSPYFARYFLSALLGFCIPFAVTAGAQRSRKWLAPALATAILLTLAFNFVRLVRHRLEGTGESLSEPSTQTILATSPGMPLEFHPLIEAIRKTSIPIAVLEPTNFLYFAQYAPDLVPRLYYLHSTDRDVFVRGFHDFRPWSPITYNEPVVGVASVPSSASGFYIYAPVGHLEEFYRLSHDFSIKSFKAADNNFLAKVERLITIKPNS